MTPLSDRHRQLGATLTDDGQPLTYGSDRSAEYLAASQHAGLADLSNRGKVEVQGKDRVQLLHNLSTNDVKKLPAGRGCEAFFLDAKGRIREYGTIFNTGDSHWIDTPAGRASDLVRHLDRYVIREDVTLHDRSQEYVQLHLVGPKAAAVLAQLGIEQASGWENLTIENVELAGTTCQLRRQDRSIYPGYDLLVPVDVCLSVWDLLIEASGLKPIGMETMEVLRMEAGIPAPGREIGEENFPQEMAREKQAVSFNKGCYIGQETVARLDTYGHINWILRGLIVDGDEPPQVGTPVQVGDASIGTISSSGFSFRLGKPVALAVLRYQQSQPGTHVTLGTEGSSGISAVVAELPLVGE